jgi:penicillin-binding protein 1A
VTPNQRVRLPELIAGQRRRQKRRARLARRRRRSAVVLVVIGVVLSGAAALSFAGGAAVLDNCNLNSLQPVRIGATSFVYDGKGRKMGAIPSTRNRELVPLRDVSTWMRKATIAIEDRRFYEHGGVDWEGILRAAVKDIEAGRAVQGASTITQQLVRNLYPISSQRTFDRKVKEACLAIKLSRKWSKDKILGEYLNAVYYGNHAYGVQAASQTYFNRSARTLGLPESALLAGLTQAPSQDDPFVRRDDAVRRRNEVLGAMLDNGDITARQYRQAVDTKLRLVDGRKLYDISRVAPRDRYFFNYVYDELVAKYGASTVRSGGLRVYTTVNERFQRAAETGIRNTLYLRSDPAGAVVSIDPKTGAIRAMTAEIPGGKGKNQFNLASQARRQAGSTFKAFVLTTAVNEGIDPSSTYYVSAPFHYQPDPYTPCPEGCWDVTTYDHSYSGSLSIESATLKSDNTVYARLTLDLGPERVAAMAHALGIRTKLPPFPSMGLGSIAVSPLEMASAYATLAAGGIYSKPTGIRRVVLANTNDADPDAGWGVPVRKRVIPDWVAAEVTRVLIENVQSGTGVGAAFGRPAAGKTGTTTNHADAWFCGYTPNLSTTVWVGYPKGEIPMESVHGIAVAGGTFPADIFRLFMTPASQGTPYTEFPVVDTSPVWHSWRGQYQYQGGYYDSGLSSSETTTTDGQTTVPQQPAEPATPRTKPTQAARPPATPGRPVAPPRPLPPE